ncbi:MAG: hypothetical protein ABSE84_32945, partial [Isosphaeraceae bacterium]
LTDSAAFSPTNPPADAISGSQGPQLVINNATAASNGSYTCVATNTAGSVTTTASVLTVTSSTSPGYVISLSARALVKTGDQILIGGFFIVGTTSRTVLVQAIGPSLSLVGLNGGLLSDPSLAIHWYDSNGVDHILYTNTGWSTGVPSIDSILSNTAANAGATPPRRHLRAELRLGLRALRKPAGATRTGTEVDLSRQCRGHLGG